MNSPDSREGDRDDSHAQQLHPGPNQHAEQHRVLGGGAEDVGVDQLFVPQRAPQAKAYRRARGAA